VNKLSAAYVCVLPESISETAKTLLLSGLPAFRREKAERYMHCRDRLLSAAVWYLLRHSVYVFSGYDAFSLAVTVDELRKPAFATDIGVHFSLSHCHNAVACAVSRYPCGVDIEPSRVADLEIARRFMPDRYDELVRITDRGGRNDFYTRSWTGIESIYKTGVAKEGALPEGYGVYHFHKHGYYIAVCAKSHGGQIELIHADFSEFLSGSF
jgi:4'-phosphopantetheinyl transferase